MNYEPKYNRNELKWPLDNRPKGLHGIKPNPDYYTEEGIIERDIHYAYLKHKAQARFRNEAYSLTPEQWKAIWTVDVWMQRGRGKDCLCLFQTTPGEGWHLNNVTIGTRMEYLKRNKEYRELGLGPTKGNHGRG